MFTRFVSPLQQLAADHRDIPVDRIETVRPFAIAPWEERVEAITEDDEKVAELANAGWAVRVGTSSSRKNSLVGFGAAIRTPISVRGGIPFNLLSVTTATRDKQNPYTAELTAISKALETLLYPSLEHRRIIVFISNKAAALALRRPRQQSGQETIIRVYDTIRELRSRGNKVTLIWIPRNDNRTFGLAPLAEEAAKWST